MNPWLIAVTASPRRHAILDELGVKYSIFRPNVQEIHEPLNSVYTAITNACAKHAVCAALHPYAWILAADTVVEFDGRCLGKPADYADAQRMLLSFSGKSQTVITVVAVSTPYHPVEVRVTASAVEFKTLTPELVNKYLQKAQTLDRAGAYDINTYGDMIISSYTGSYTNIMGLPSEVVADFLRANGYSLKITKNSLL